MTHKDSFSLIHLLQICIIVISYGLELKIFMKYCRLLLLWPLLMYANLAVKLVKPFAIKVWTDLMYNSYSYSTLGCRNGIGNESNSYSWEKEYSRNRIRKCTSQFGSLNGCSISFLCLGRTKYPFSST